MKMPIKDLIYVFCVTRTKPRHTDFEKLGIGIYPIYSQGTYAIVSKVSATEFSEDGLKKKLADMGWVEKNVRQHELIVEEIMKETPVLPLKFATVFQTEENVVNLLKKHGMEFKKIIADLENKEEWGLKIYCDLEKLKATLKTKDEMIRGKGQEIASAGKGKAYFLKKKRDKLLENTISRRISEYTQDSFERLRKISFEAKINKTLPREVTEKKDEMVLNSAFLVTNKRTKEFKGVLEHLKAKYSDKGMGLDCSGPWPPYNFCSLNNVKVKHG